jgi:hypothetical protein
MGFGFSTGLHKRAVSCEGLTGIVLGRFSAKIDERSRQSTQASESDLEPERNVLVTEVIGKLE